MATIDYIGSQYFIWVKGDVQGPRMTLEEIVRSGVDGRAWKQMGIKSPEFELHSLVDLPDASYVAGTTQIYESMVGTIVDFSTLGQFATWSGFLVLDVTIGETCAAGSPVGGVNAGSVLMHATWKMVYVS